MDNEPKKETGYIVIDNEELFLGLYHTAEEAKKTLTDDYQTGHKTIEDINNYRIFYGEKLTFNAATSCLININF